MKQKTTKLYVNVVISISVITKADNWLETYNVNFLIFI